MTGGRGQVVLATDHLGAPVVVGPVYTDQGIEELRRMIENKPGWTVEGTARIISKAALPWESR